VAAIDSLQARLKAKEVIIMDGGTGSEIRFRGVSLAGKSWSGEPMLTHPDTVREIHEDYIKAGAEIIITNTFSTGRYILKQAGLEDRTVELNELGVRLAQEARDNSASGKPLLIAGSMSTYSPWGEPAVIPSYEAALADYREQSRVLAEAGVDVIVVEMLIRTLDARAAAEAAAETGLPIWIGYSVVQDSGKVYVGMNGKHNKESIKEGVEAVSSAGVSAFFIMHSSLEDTAPGLRELRQCTELPIGAYAHAVLHPNRRQRDEIAWQDVSPADHLEYARGWVDIGAQIIGGCCGIRPDHIRALKEGLPSRLPA